MVEARTEGSFAPTGPDAPRAPLPALSWFCTGLCRVSALRVGLTGGLGALVHAGDPAVSGRLLPPGWGGASTQRDWRGSQQLPWALAVTATGAGLGFDPPGGLCCNQTNRIELLWATGQRRDVLDLVTFFFGSPFTVEGSDPYSISAYFSARQIRKRMKHLGVCLQRLPREERFYRHQTPSPRQPTFRPEWGERGVHAGDQASGCPSGP